MTRLTSLTGLLLGFATSSAFAAAPTTVEELWQIIQQQQAEINSLKKAAKKNEQTIKTTIIKVDEADSKIEAAASALESGTLGSSSKSQWTERVKMGGYGEVLYNNGTQRSNDASPSRPNKEIDVQRFVLYFANEFNEDVRFFSEIEVEHTNTAGAGEVEMEQAYVEWDYAGEQSVLAGLYLVPVGIMNETHEPDTFFGVERNLIESRIIPTTYRVNGIKFSGEFAPGWSYDLGIHEGLQLADNFSIRSSRQSGSRANAEELAGTARIKFTGAPGLEVGVAMQYQSDLVQDGIGNDRLGRSAFATDDISGLLTEAHIAYRSGGFGLRALYAKWSIDDAIEDLGGSGRDSQIGWYIEPSYRFGDDWGVFARYELVDERDGDDAATEDQRTLVGANYWVTSNVVLKADIQFEDDEGDSDELDGFNLGVGWSF